jgi:hypothetical protein
MKVSSGDFGRRERREVESELRERVASARADYEEALSRAQRLLETARDVGTTHPDGTSAMRMATRLQQTATLRYAEALTAFSNFILNRKLR